MSSPCVCGGRNENCRHCGGRGEIGDRLAGALVTHSKHPSTLNGGRKTKAEKRMETETEIRKIERRLLRFQQLRSLASGAPDSCNAVSRLVPCPMACGEQLDPQEVNRHLHRKHKPSTKYRQPIAADSVRPQEWQSCPICKAHVKVRNLQPHLKKVHAKTEAWERTPLHKSAGTPTVESVKDALRENTTLASPRDKNLDATKLYAHSFRESGRFGSHPSHDGFDDESGPE
jgi:hypothetical protein